MKEPILTEAKPATLTPAKRVKRKGRDLETGGKNQFGVCPVCRQTDGFLTLDFDHYFVCHEHKLRWYVGSSTLASEFFDITRKNLELIGDYKDAKPVYFSLRDRFNGLLNRRFYPALDRVLNRFGLVRVTSETPF